MGDYSVTYRGMEEEKPNNFYLVDYVRKDAQGNELGYVTSGTQSPSLQKAIGMGLCKNRTRGYWF